MLQLGKLVPAGVFFYLGHRLAGDHLGVEEDRPDETAYVLVDQAVFGYTHFSKFDDVDLAVVFARRPPSFVCADVQQLENVVHLFLNVARQAGALLYYVIFIHF